MRVLNIILFVFLCGCSSLSGNEKYPSIENECQELGIDSIPCRILSMENWPIDEKQQVMGYIYLFPNDGLEQNCNKAKYWFEKSAKANNSEALNNLGLIYSLGCGIEKDFEKAEHYYLLAIEAGSHQAQPNLAELYRKGGFGIKKDYIKALQLYELSTEYVPDRAYYGMASIYFEKGDLEHAYINTVNASNLGHTEAEYNLAYMYDEGIYVDQNKEKAEYWYKKAAEKGHPSAQKNLEILLNKAAN